MSWLFPSSSKEINALTKFVSSPEELAKYKFDEQAWTKQVTADERLVNLCGQAPSTLRCKYERERELAKHSPTPESDDDWIEE